jgi:hypothetical protein
MEVEFLIPLPTSAGGAAQVSPARNLDYSHYLLEKKEGCSKR